MTISILNMKALRNVVQRLITAEVEHSWKGSKAPSEQAEIEAELTKAKNAYRRVLTRIGEAK